MPAEMPKREEVRERIVERVCREGGVRYDGVEGGKGEGGRRGEGEGRGCIYLGVVLHGLGDDGVDG